jgi:hypothetical protein
MLWLAGVPAAAFSVGCTDDGQGPVLLSVSPASAFSNREITLVVTGEGFRPRVGLSSTSGAITDQSSGFELAFVPASGGDPVSLKDARQTSGSTLTVKAPAKLPKDTYAMTLSDSRGHLVVLPAAFDSLGPDVDPPSVRLLSPLTAEVFSETVATFAFAVDDPSGPLSLNINIKAPLSTDPDDDVRAFPCPLPCSFDREMPLLADDQLFVAYTVTATAFDGTGNSKDLEFSFHVIHLPVVEQLLPRSGSMAGGTSVVVRGAWFPAEGQVLFDGVPLVPAGGEHSSDGKMIRGWTPSHPPGVARVTLKSTAGTVDLPSFSFIASPLIKTAVPPTLPTTGCHLLRLIGNDFPTDASWFMGHDTGDRLLVQRVTLDPSGLLASLCVGARFGAGPLSLFLDSESAGAARLDGAFAFEIADPQTETAAPECPCP